MSTDNKQPHRVDDRREEDGRDTYRVAVVLFAEAKGADRLDAAHGTSMAIKSALAQAGAETVHGVFHIETDGRATSYAPNDVYLVTDIYTVMDAGMALANGYLWCEPTRRAYPTDNGTTS